MPRCGVSDAIAERTYGHRIGGVEAIYNRHAYFDEKAEALNRLAALLSKVQSVDQRMRLKCGVGFRQLRTCRRTRPGSDVPRAVIHLAMAPSRTAS